MEAGKCVFNLILCKQVRRANAFYRHVHGNSCLKRFKSELKEEIDYSDICNR